MDKIQNQNFYLSYQPLFDLDFKFNNVFIFRLSVVSESKTIRNANAVRRLYPYFV